MILLHTLTSVRVVGSLSPADSYITIRSGQILIYELTGDVENTYYNYADPTLKPTDRRQSVGFTLTSQTLSTLTRFDEVPLITGLRGSYII
jgi:hypothetical protein